MQVLSEELVYINTQFSSQAEVFEFAADKLCENGRAVESAKLVDGFMHREKQFSTYIDHGVAIPHCKVEQVKCATAIICRNESPLLWSEEQDKATLFILLAVPKDNPSNDHLRMLARLAQSLMDEELVEQLKTIDDPKGIYDVLKVVNQTEEV